MTTSEQTIVYDKNWVLDTRKQVLGLLGVSNSIELKPDLRKTQAFICFTQVLGEALEYLKEETVLSDDYVTAIRDSIPRLFTAVWVKSGKVKIESAHRELDLMHQTTD